MESALNFLDSLDAISGIYVSIIGIMFMFMANICHVMKRKSSVLLSTIFATLASIMFLFVWFGIFPDLSMTSFAMPAITLSAYFIALFYAEEIKYVAIMSLIIAIAFSSTFYLAGLPLFLTILVAVGAFAVLTALSVIISVSVSIFSRKQGRYAVRFFGVVFYFLLSVMFINLIV